MPPPNAPCCLCLAQSPPRTDARQSAEPKLLLTASLTVAKRMVCGNFYPRPCFLYALCCVCCLPAVYVLVRIGNERAARKLILRPLCYTAQRSE